MIEDPRGQWAHPGKNTRIPGNQITMKGVDYPVWAVPDVGEPVLMQPGQEYTFPGASYVDEYPMLKQGGQLPNAQDGKSIDAMLQTASEYEPTIAGHNENKDFLLKMVDSPLFGDRYKAMSGNPNLTDAEILNYQNSIKNNINTAKLQDFKEVYARRKVLDQESTLESNGFYIPHLDNTDARTYNKLNKGVEKAHKKIDNKLGKFLVKKTGIPASFMHNYIDGVKFMGDNQHTVNISVGKDYNKSMDLHETSHSSTKGDVDLRAKEEPIANMSPAAVDFISYNPKNVHYVDYLHQKTEQKARIDVLRKFMLDNGIYDATKEVFTLDHYDKANEALENNKHTLSFNPKLDSQLKEILNFYGSKDIETMMNSFVQNKTENEGQLPIAKQGGEYETKELTDAEIEEYVKGGYIVEEELPKAQMGINGTLEPITLDDNPTDNMDPSGSGMNMDIEGIRNNLSPFIKDYVDYKDL